MLKSNIKKNTIYVFGSSGYIGDNLARHLDSRERVVKVGRSKSDLYFDLSTSDPETLSGLVGSGDIWVFLAAISSPDVCSKEKSYAFNVNVTRTIELINWLTSKSIKVIFSSSDAVFGKSEGISFDSDQLNPLGEYAIMKELVEYAVIDNDFVKVVRFSYVIGREDKFSKMLNKAESNGNVVQIYNGFERNIVFLDDVVKGIEGLIDKWDSFDFKAANFSGPLLVSRSKLVHALVQEIFPNLRFELSDPPAKFWESRAKSIATDCKNFTSILGRKPKGLSSLKEVW